ncbi:hypothetical protein [Sporosarcina sp. OR05]|uniref:hypothetical protein n=1 Tax=Sporosarcina sp. OR05 TaxID=2969819 RepID=UPI00352A5187
MKKTDEEIVDEISDYLHGYLKDGTVSIQSFFSKVNIDIKNIQDLLKIRFLLLPETIEFVRNLGDNIQTIKTTTMVQSSTHHGEVRGQIDWTETTKERLRRNYKDKTIFAVSESLRSYNNPENLVLKELLQVFYDLLFQEQVVKSIEQRKWYKEWQQLKIQVAHTFLKNVYMERITTSAVPDRILAKILQHRNAFYREAAALLILYRKLMRGSYDKEDLQQVLGKTFIEPENRDVLFELYWIVQVMKANSSEYKLLLLDGTQNMVATWEDEHKTYRLYHDSIGSQKKRFLIRLSEIANSDNPYLQRKHMAMTTYRTLAFELFGEKKSDILSQGRPDILLEIRDKMTEKLTKIVIGEVKNTSSIDYASVGLNELLEYIYLMKDEAGNYMYESGIEVSGILCLREGKFNNHTTNALVKFYDMASAIEKLKA